MDMENAVTMTLQEFIQARYKRCAAAVKLITGGSEDGLASLRMLWTAQYWEARAVREVKILAELRTFTADDEHVAEHISATLIAKSKWFECTPLPDGLYEFKVKNEPGLPDWPNLIMRCLHCLDRPGFDGLGRTCKFCNGDVLFLRKVSQ